MVQDTVGIERRKYIRVNTVFPVEFQILSADGLQVLSEFAQSFTRDVNESGMRLEVNNLKDELAEKVSSKAAKLSLQINVPFSTKPISATAQVAWIKKIKEEPPNKFLIGISYETISDRERKRIVNYAKALRLRPKLIATAIAILALAVVTSTVLVSKKEALRKEAEKKLALIQQERQKLTQALDDLQLSHSALTSKLKTFEEERKELEKKLELARARARPEEVIKLEADLAKAQVQLDELNKELTKVATDKGKLEEQLEVLEEIKAAKPVKVVLAQGGVVVGKVVLETADVVRVEVPTGVITLKRDQISSMTTPTKEEITELAKQRIELEGRAREFERRKAKEVKEVAKVEVKIPKFPLPAEVEEKGIVIKNKRIYINGSLFFIKGIAYGISMPGLPPGVEGGGFNKIPTSVFENDFRMMKETGINTIRTYEPLPDSLLDLIEKYDLKVIEQVVYPSAYTDYASKEQLNSLKRMATEVVKKHKNRKCILMWSIWNDAPFLYDEPGNPIPHYGFDTVNNFMKEIYLAIKAVDKGHPVTAANILNVQGYELGLDFLDVIGCNAYIGGHGYGWRGKEDALRSIKTMVEISNKYNKPVFITETGYSTFVKKDSQDKALEVQIKSVDESVAGIVIFEWADEWWKGGEPAVHNEHIEEHWGIVTWDRKPKPGFEVVSQLFNTIPTDSLGYSEK